MKQAIDVLAVFEVGSKAPRPIRFKMQDQGIKKTIPVTNINNTEWIRAGGTTRVVYYCDTVNEGRRIIYSLHYFYTENRWEVEM